MTLPAGSPGSREDYSRLMGAPDAKGRNFRLI
jgi:hypothetical protein